MLYTFLVTYQLYVLSYIVVQQSMHGYRRVLHYYVNGKLWSWIFTYMLVTQVFHYGLDAPHFPAMVSIIPAPQT